MAESAREYDEKYVSQPPMAVPPTLRRGKPVSAIVRARGSDDSHARPYRSQAVSSPEIMPFVLEEQSVTPRLSENCTPFVARSSLSDKTAMPRKRAQGEDESNEGEDEGRRLQAVDDAGDSERVGTIGSDFSPCPTLETSEISTPSVSYQSATTDRHVEVRTAFPEEQKQLNDLVHRVHGRAHTL